MITNAKLKPVVSTNIHAWIIVAPSPNIWNELDTTLEAKQKQDQPVNEHLRI
jgi:hypothetical protein